MEAAAAHVQTNSIFDDGTGWSDFFRITGYMPGISYVTGPTRAAIGFIGTVINAIAIPIFAGLKENDSYHESIENLKKSFLWVVRGIVETKPFIGNAIAWNWDTLAYRFKGEVYKSGFLHDWRFTPGLSIFTGTLRSVRGCTGTVGGGLSEVFLRTMKLVHVPVSEIDKKIKASHSYIFESLVEIPQGLIEMIPLGDSFCPPLKRLADKIEQYKIDLGKENRPQVVAA